MKRNKTDVRLEENEKKAILKSVAEVSAQFDLKCQEVSLFGSRALPDAKGGDIDLYVKVRKVLDPELLYEVRLKMKRSILDQIGEQKLDLVIDDGRVNLGAFKEIILSQKVIIWMKK